MTNKETVGTYLRGLRGNRPVKPFAKSLGLGYNTINRAESGSHPPSERTIETIIVQLQLPTEEAHRLKILAAAEREKRRKPTEKVVFSPLDVSQEYPEDELAQRPIHEVLPYIRKRAGLTLLAVTENGGLPENTIVYIESGRIKTPTPETLRKIRKGLGLPDDTLLLQSQDIKRHSTVKRVPEISEKDLADLTPAEKLTYWRRKSRLGRPEIAKRLQVSVGEVARWEKGKRPPKALRDPLAYLLDIPQEQLAKLFAPPTIEPEQLNRMNLSELVNYYREQAEITLPQLARNAEIHRATLRSLLQNNVPSDETVIKLIKGLGLVEDGEEANRLRRAMAQLFFA